MNRSWKRYPEHKAQIFDMPTLSTIVRLHAALLLFIGSSSLVAQQDSGAPLKPDALSDRITTLEAADGDDTSGDRARAIANYVEALRIAEQLLASGEKMAEFRRQIEEAPVKREQLAAESHGLSDDEQPPNEESETVDLTALTTVFETIKTRLDLAQAAVASHVEEEKRRVERLAGLPDLIAKATADLAALPDVSPPLATATEVDRSAYELAAGNRELLRQERETLQAELQFYEATAALFAAKGGHANQRLVGLTDSAAAWQALIDRRRLASTGEAADRARADARRLAGNSEAQIIAEESAELTAKHGALSRQMADASKRLAKLARLETRVSQQPAAALRRVTLLEAAKLRIDPATGRLLRHQRRDLPEPSQLRKQTREVLTESAQAQIDLIELEGRLAELTAEQIAEDLKSVSETRILHLSVLIDDYRVHIGALTKSATHLKVLTTETAKFAAFIDARLLWIPDSPPISLGDFQTEVDVVRQLFTANPFRAFSDDFSRYPLLWIFVAAAIAGLAIRRRPQIAKLAEQGKLARKRNCTSFISTAQALWLTILISGPVPFVFWFLYARGIDLPSGVAEGLRNVAGFLTFGILFKTIARPEGLMIDHFRADASRAALLRRHLRWIVPVLAPFVFFLTALPIEFEESPAAGRLFLIVALVGLAIAFALLLRPSVGFISSSALAKICFAIGVAAPVALAAGAMAGFHGSVREIRIQALSSLLLVLVVLLAITAGFWFPGVD
jgi:potassium efflux system protein